MDEKQSNAKQTPFIKEENIGKSQLDYHKSLLSVLRNRVLNKRKISLKNIRTFKTCFLCLRQKTKFLCLKRLKQSSDSLSNSRLKSNKDFSVGTRRNIYRKIVAQMKISKFLSFFLFHNCLTFFLFSQMIDSFLREAKYFLFCVF